MANKLVKELKKGDKFKSSVSDGTKVYLSWCTITDINDITIYNPNGLKTLNNGRLVLKNLSYVVDSGPLKGMKYTDVYVNEDGTMIVPNRLPKWRRVLKELFSS